MARRMRIAAFSFVEHCSAAAAPVWSELHSSARVHPKITNPRRRLQELMRTCSPFVAQSPFRGAAGGGWAREFLIE